MGADTVASPLDEVLLPAGARRLRLLALHEEPSRQREAEIQKVLTLFGTQPGCHVMLADGLVSKVHCAIVHTGERVWVRHFGIASPTLLNGRPFDLRELQDEDVLQIGGQSFRIRLAAAAEPLNEPATNDQSIWALLHREHCEQRVNVQRPIFTVGRQANNDLVVADTSLSRHHALLVRLGSEIVICDLHSGNGTWVNDQRIKRVRLQDADRLLFGLVAFQIQLTVKSPAPLNDPSVAGHPVHEIRDQILLGRTVVGPTQPLVGVDLPEETLVAHPLRLESEALWDVELAAEPLHHRRNGHRAGVNGRGLDAAAYEQFRPEREAQLNEQERRLARLQQELDARQSELEKHATELHQERFLLEHQQTQLEQLALTMQSQREQIQQREMELTSRLAAEQLQQLARQRESAEFEQRQQLQDAQACRLAEEATRLQEARRQLHLKLQEFHHTIELCRQNLQTANQFEAL